MNTTFKLAMAGALAMLASSRAEAQQAVSVPGTPGWGANSGYPAASPWRRSWPRVVSGLRGRQMRYQYPATASPGYSAPQRGYYYYYPSTTPTYTQRVQPAYTVSPQPSYAPMVQPAAPAAPATPMGAPAYAPATTPAAVIPGAVSPGMTASDSATPASQPIGPDNPSAGTGRDVSMHKPWMPPSP